MKMNKSEKEAKHNSARNNKKMKKLGKVAKKEEKEAKKESAKKEQAAQALYLDKIVPICSFDEQHNYGIMFDGTIIDMLKIRAKDIYAADPEENFLEQLQWDRLYKTFPGDIKVFSFFFPTETLQQQKYIDKVATRTVNPIYRELLADEKERMIEIHNSCFDKQYVLCFFAKDKTEHEQYLFQIKSMLNRSTTPLVSEIPIDQKKRIIYKLYNKNLNL